MRELRFVTLTEDGGRLLVQAPNGGEKFALAVDPKLRAAVTAARAVEPAPAAPPVRAEVPISPREIQVRVRAGESPQDIADGYGVALDRVMRFAGAAIDERARIAGEARRSRARRTGLEGAEGRIVMFGEAVDERFRAHGIETEAVTWDARRRDDGEWLVVASWPRGDDNHVAEWLFSRAARTVNPLDDTAVDLLSDRPIRPALPPEPERPSLAAAPPLAPGVVAFPPMADALTGPVPKVVEDVFDQEAPPEGPRQIPPMVSAASTGPAFDEPPLPLGLGAEPPNVDAEPRNGGGERRKVGAEPRKRGTGRRDETEEERAARARVPSWDDILLGIRRKD